MKKKGNLFKNNFSLKKSILLCFLLCLIPTDLLFLFYTRYSVRQLYGKAAESYRVSLERAVQNFEAKLYDTEVSLSTQYINSVEVQYIKHSDSAGERYRMGYRLCNDIFWAAGADGVSCVYDGSQFHYKSPVGESHGLSYSKMFRNIEGEQDFDTSGWKIRQSGADSFLVRMIGSDNVYAGQAYLIDQTFLSRYFIASKDALIYLADNTGRPLTYTDLEEDDWSFDISKNEYSLSSHGDRLLIGCGLSSLPLRVVYVLPAGDVLKNARLSQVVFWIMVILSSATVVLAVTYLKRRVTLPLSQLKDTITSIQASDFTSAPPSQAAVEIQEVYDTFTSMIDVIRGLRIQSYEEQLEKQKFQIQYYQLQMKPHFYLNCLKSLYGLAQKGKNEEMQQMILSFSEQFQFLAYDATALIPLHEEIRHTQNYVNIQEIGKGSPIHVSLSAASETLDLPVPPLLLQTFVENAVKYAARFDTELCITIRAKTEILDEGKYLHVLIQDNGPGYPEHVLTAFEDAAHNDASHQHVGLYNLNMRLRLIYKEDAYLLLRNQNGAVAEILLPAEPKERGENREYLNH